MPPTEEGLALYRERSIETVLKTHNILLRYVSEKTSRQIIDDLQEALIIPCYFPED